MWFRYGTVRKCAVGFGYARRGEVRQGMVSYGKDIHLWFRIGSARFSKVRYGTVRLG